MKCERGELAFEINIDAKGLIGGFVGHSRGVTPPPAVVAAFQGALSVHNKWDDKLYAKHLAKFAPIEQAKKMTAQWREKQGTCKAIGGLHSGFDWGFTIDCTKGGKFDVYAAFAPDDADKAVMIRIQPVPFAP